MGTKKDLKKAWFYNIAHNIPIRETDTSAASLNFDQVGFLTRFYDDVDCIYTSEIKTLQQALDIYRASIEYVTFNDWIGDDPDALDMFHKIVATPDALRIAMHRLSRLADECVLTKGHVVPSDLHSVGVEIRALVEAV